MTGISRVLRGIAASAAVLSLAACSTFGENQTASDGSTAEASARPSPNGEVVLLTHESFNLPKKLIAQFEEQSGQKLTVRAAGDAGTLATKLALSAGNPEGDVVFGIDNSFASRPIDEGALASYSPTLPSGAETYALTEGADKLVPIDNGNVCVNVDTAWFKENQQTPPQTLDDLADPAYQDLFVAPGASTSSPGMAFLLATIAAKGDAWGDYWTTLMDNGTKITSGWSDAYFTEFTAAGEKGTRPIVVSYDSSPAFTLTGKGANQTSTTAALLDTCFQQVEYAGVLANAKNPVGAEAFVDFLLTPQVQAALPESMYVFPVADDVELPADWAKFAVRPEAPAMMDPAEIADNREQWLTEWTEITSR